MTGNPYRDAVMHAAEYQEDGSYAIASAALAAICIIWANKERNHDIVRNGTIASQDMPPI